MVMDLEETGTYLLNAKVGKLFCNTIIPLLFHYYYHLDPYFICKLICDRICEKVPFSHTKFDPFCEL